MITKSTAVQEIFKLVKKKMKRSLPLPSLTAKRDVDDDGEDQMGSSMEVPQDVKKGQFVVFAVDGCGEPKRFVVDLGFLTHPEFLKMLKQSEEEFGYEQQGAISVPCRPDDLQKILEEKRKYSSGYGGSNAKRKTLVVP